ncbi:MAG: hypothetical protein WC208_13825 [Gallionella sp.]|jgi:hypothetical protein
MSKWFSLNGLGEEDEMALRCFGIPLTFSTDDIYPYLEYHGICSDPLTGVITFQPNLQSLETYDDEDVLLLLNWYGFDMPDRAVETMMTGSRRKANEWYQAITEEYGFSLGERRYPNAYSVPINQYMSRFFLMYALRLLEEEKYLVTDSEVDSETEPTTLITRATYPQWKEKYYSWFLSHAKYLLLYHASVSRYISSEYQAINEACRSDNPLADPTTLKLLQLFKRVPPTPIKLFVSRRLKGVEATSLPLGTTLVEKGFMSTSLVSLDAEFHQSRFGYSLPLTYLTLLVDEGTEVLNLIPVSESEYELVFAPGVKYVLDAREVYESGVVGYRGRVVR